MFVRWKSQRITRGPFAGGTRHQAVLVACHRVDGKPRQQYIKCLGTYRESPTCSDLMAKFRTMDRFWSTAERPLDFGRLARRGTVADRTATR